MKLILIDNEVNLHTVVIFSSFSDFLCVEIALQNAIEMWSNKISWRHLLLYKQYFLSGMNDAMQVLQKEVILNKT